MLGLLDRFRKKKVIHIETVKTTSQLEQLCGGDKETYEALFHTMFLDPRKVGTSMKEAADNAKKFETAKDFIKARMWYEIAGGLAIYEGNVKKVVEFFSEIEKISPATKYTILKNPEKALAKAQEYYKQYLGSNP
jgi:hypothetical protein